MKLLKKAVNEQAYLKAGFLGFPGSGKTYTASMMAIGLAHRLGGNKPVAFFDTETGSDFLVSRFETEKIELLRVKSHAFSDLLEAGREAEGVCCAMIVDSISHVWRELCESYRKRKNLSRLSFQHWADIKREWAAWTNFYLNSRLHIFVLGRAGYEYDFEADEEGKKELIKVGTKMKVETEFGFEPSLLIEMERASKGSAPGAGWVHRAHILKDRTDTINGKAFNFEKPGKAYKTGDWKVTLKPFEPVLNALSIRGEHVGIDASRTSEDLFSGPDNQGTWAMKEKRKEIALDEIKNSLENIVPGKTDEARKTKSSICEELLGCRVWSAVEVLPLHNLEVVVQKLRRIEEFMQTSEPETAKDMLGVVKMLNKPEKDAAVSN